MTTRDENRAAIWGLLAQHGDPDTRRARHVPALRTEGEDGVSAEDDGVDWAEVAWDDLELRGEARCCDSRDHTNGTDDDVQCRCPKHPRSYLHPAGEREWPAP